MTGAKVLLGETLKGAKVELGLQELATGRTFVCAISNGGKSHTMRRVVEQTFGQVGVIIVDVEGEYCSLREDPHYPFLIIGKDIPLVPEAAEFLADQILSNDLSVIIDGSDVNLDEATFQEFIQRFILRFLVLETAKRKPYLFIFEEADELAPERNFAKSLCGPAIMRLAKKGRKRGCGMITVTQRPQSVAKGVISQSRGKIIGQLDWQPDKEVVEKFARIPHEIADKLDTFKRGDFYVSGDFIAKPAIVHVGPVITKHVGETPEVVPPAPKELASTLAALNKKLPSIIKETLAPAIPKEAEIEARIKTKFEAQWQARLGRVEKERDAARHKTEAKYEVQIADLKRKLDDAVRHATLKGGVSDLLSHPLVQRSLEKLTPKQRSLVELLETKGAQDAEHCSLFLECKPHSVSDFMSEVNRRIPRLVERTSSGYVSRLAKLFPVNEEAQAEAKEVEELKQGLAASHAIQEDLASRLDVAVKAKNELASQIQEMRQMVAKVAKERDILRTTNQRLVDIAQGKSIPADHPDDSLSDHSLEDKSLIPGSPGTSQEIQVEATLHRTLIKFNVATNKEVLDADESTPIGRLLATGLRGFFKQPQGWGAIIDEQERKYAVNIKNSGGAKKSLQTALEELVSKDILDRKVQEKQWVYFETPHFTERVQPLQGAASA